LEFLGEDLISSGDDGRVTCWTAAGVARWTHRVVAGPLVGLRVEAKTKQIAIAGGSTVHLLDAADGRILLALEHLRPVNSVRFAERGGRVVTAGSDGFVRVWKLESGALELLLSGHRGEATAAAFCGADGAHVASGGADGTARVWETANGRSLGALEGHGDRVSYLECDSTRVVTGSVDGTVRVWTSREPQVVSRIIPGTRAISMLDVSSDDERILVSEYGVRASVWDRQGRRRYAIEAPVATATFSPDGRQIVTAEGARGVARLWDADRQVEIATFHGSPDVNYAELSPTGDLLVTSSAAGTPELWRADSGSLVLRLTGHERQVLTATFRPDGKRVATASQDNTARVWSLDGREHATLRGHSSYVLSAFFDPSGQRLVTGGSDQTVRVWDAETGRPLQTMAGHTGEVAAAAYSKDGALIASASADRTARVWEARTGRLLQVLSGHTGRVSFVTFSRDGHLFTAGEEDGIVLEWDVGRFSGSAAEVTQALGCRQPFDLRDGKVVRRPGCE
jgi:WD40 repeat protein